MKMHDPRLRVIDSPRKIYVGHPKRRGHFLIMDCPDDVIIVFEYT